MRDSSATLEMFADEHQSKPNRSVSKPNSKNTKTLDNNSAKAYNDRKLYLERSISNSDTSLDDKHSLEDAFSDLYSRCVQDGKDDLAHEVAKLAGKLGTRLSWASRVKATASNSPDPVLEPQVRAAVEELRDQFWNREVPRQRPYPGRRSGTDPIEFVIEHYGQYIRSGQLGPGQLQGFDRNLYMALREELPRRAIQAVKSGVENPPETVAAFFDQMADEAKRGSAFQRRVRACAAILGTSETEAARFFGIRPERVKTDEKSISLR